jgi:hypothetical protein
MSYKHFAPSIKQIVDFEPACGMLKLVSLSKTAGRNAYSVFPLDVQKDREARDYFSTGECLLTTDD